MTKHFVITWFCLLLIGGSFSSCNKKQKLLSPTEDREKLEKYFTAATVGVISSNDQLTYVLKSPVAAENYTPEQLQKVISLSPSVKGIVSLTNNTILTFKPEKPLGSDALYTVNIDLPALSKTTFKENITYDIKTIKQDIFIKTEGIYINDDDARSVLLHVSTADAINIEDLKKCFADVKQQIEITDKGNNRYTVDIKFPKNTVVPTSITAKGGAVSVKEDTKIDIPVYASDKFYVAQHHHDLISNTLNIYFSQKLDETQDLTGLIDVNQQASNYTVSNNKVTVFLADNNIINDNEEYDENGNIIPSTEAKAIVTLNDGIKSASGSLLSKIEIISLSLEASKPDARFMDKGNYFPSEGKMKIPIQTRGLNRLRIMVIEIKQENAVHYMAWNRISDNNLYNIRMYGRPVYNEIVDLANADTDPEGWSVHGIDLTDRIKRHHGSLYYVSLDFGPEFCKLACAKALVDKEGVKSKLPSMQYFDERNDYYDDYYYSEDDSYNWNHRGDPCKPAYYVHRQLSNQLFVCSNYSVIVKKGENDYHIALSKLLDLSNASSTEVSLYNLQGESIATKSTDGNGMVMFEDMTQQAAVIKIGKADQTTYLSLDEDESNSLTEFDISGDKSDIESSMYIYGERNVWRPGDTVFVNLMINKSQVELPAGIPVEYTLYNTENVVVDKQVNTYKADQSIYSFYSRTNSTAKTGVYRAVFKMGPKRISKNIRIETIKPNAVETVFAFNNQKGDMIYSEFLAGKLTTQYLNGLPLQNTKVSTMARVNTMIKPFADFGNYAFNVHPINTANNIAIFDGVTNGSGSAAIEYGESFKSYNSPVSISIETETTLADGGTNKEGKKINLSPFTSYIGCKHVLGKGWNGSHMLNENVGFDLVNVSSLGKKMSQSNTVTWVVQKNSQSWWIDKYRLRSAGQYTESSYWSDVKNGTTKVTGQAGFSLPKGSLVAGAYRVIFEDAASGHRSEEYFNVYDGTKFAPDSSPEFANIVTDNDEYKSGDPVNVSLPHIANAKVLISIERGNKVIEQQWHTMGTNSAPIALKSNESWAPNVYIHATIMQQYEQTANDLPLRMYGVKHITVTDIQGPLKPVATIADVLESNKSYTFQVSESSGKALEYTYALVDEGLLNLTGFETPDPNKHFNGRYPLLVKTWDIYKYLIQFFKGKFAGVISIGGDNAYHPDAIAEVNRFKPLVIQKGSFVLKAGGKNSHTIKIPNYIGKVRLMIVAAGANRYGHFEKLIPVKNALMVQSQLPRSLNISDKLAIPVTVMRDDKSITSASLSGSVSNGMARGLGVKNIAFNGQNQLTQMMDLEVIKAGPMKLNMEISNGTKKMNESTDILVNYPNSYQTSSVKNVIKPGSKATFKTKVEGYPEVFTSTLSVAGANFPNLGSMADNLLQYPYGCLEQTTSAAFGQLYIDKIFMMDAGQKSKQQGHLQTALDRLTKFQKGDGRFSYWDNDYYHPWSDIYAGNFLVEMKQLNLIPSSRQDMLNNWLRAQEKIASTWAMSQNTDSYSYNSESLAQAYRLYVLSKANRSSKSALNKFASSNKSTDPLIWWMVAGAYKLSGYDSKAKEYVTKAEGLQKNVQNYYYFGSESRNLAVAVDILSTMPDLKAKRDTYYDRMVETLNKSQWHSTQEMGYAFIAAYKHFGDQLNLAKKVSYNISGLGTAITGNHSSFEAHNYGITKNNINNTITIENKGASDLYVYQNSRFIPSELNLPATANSLGMTVTYTTAKGAPATIANLGDDIYINVQVSNPSGITIEDLALNVKSPSGWELINPRMYETSSGSRNEPWSYQDFRDDRAYTFFSLGAGQKANFQFRTKAAFKGDFYLPAVTCEHMYKGNINARSVSGRVVIK